MKRRGRGIPELPSLDIPRAVAVGIDESLAGIRERHATLSKLTKFSPSSAYWRRLHMDIGVLLEVCDRQSLLLDTVSPSTAEGAAEHMKTKARADRAETVLRGLRAHLVEVADATRLRAQKQPCGSGEQLDMYQRLIALDGTLAKLDALEREHEIGGAK